MLTEQIKIKLHNALFAGGFKPTNHQRLTWVFEPSCWVSLTANEWTYNDERTDDGDYECGDYSESHVEILLKMVKRTISNS